MRKVSSWLQFPPTTHEYGVFRQSLALDLTTHPVDPLTDSFQTALGIPRYPLEGVERRSSRQTQHLSDIIDSNNDRRRRLGQEGHDPNHRLGISPTRLGVARTVGWTQTPRGRDRLWSPPERPGFGSEGGIIAGSGPGRGSGRRSRQSRGVGLRGLGGDCPPFLPYSLSHLAHLGRAVDDQFGRGLPRRQLNRPPSGRPLLRAPQGVDLATLIVQQEDKLVVWLEGVALEKDLQARKGPGRCESQSMGLVSNRVA